MAKHMENAWIFSPVTTPYNKMLCFTTPANPGTHQYQLEKKQKFVKGRKTGSPLTTKLLFFYIINHANYSMINPFNWGDLQNITNPLSNLEGYRSPMSWCKSIRYDGQLSAHMCHSHICHLHEPPTYIIHSNNQHLSTIHPTPPIGNY